MHAYGCHRVHVDVRRLHGVNSLYPPIYEFKNKLRCQGLASLTCCHIISPQRLVFKNIFFLFLFIYLFDMPDTAPHLPLPVPLHHSPLISPFFFSSVSIQERVDIPWVLVKHDISYCSKTKDLPFIKARKGDPIWEVGIQKPVKESGTALVPVVKSPIKEPSYTTVKYIQNANASPVQVPWFSIQSLQSPMSPG